MSFRTLTGSPWQSSTCEVAALEPIENPGTVGDDTIGQLLDLARNGGHTGAWAFYRAGEQMHRVGQGDPRVQWPSSVAYDEFEAFCRARNVHRWPTGRGEGVLGWLLAPVDDAAQPALAELASAWAFSSRPIPLPARRSRSVCCMKSPIWPVRPVTGQCFW